MTLSSLMLALVALLMLKAIFGFYAGDNYVCPVCGTHDRDEHNDECPWKPR
jgi:rubrerythrin